MASWGSFGWGFFVGLFVGQATLAFSLGLVRRGDTEPVAGYSPPLAAELTPAASDSEMPARLA